MLLVDNNQERAERTQRDVQDAGGASSIFLADVTQEDDCITMMDTCHERYGGLHILFNNVATYGSGKITEVSEAHIDETLAINLKSMMLTCKHAVPLMAASGGGSIINIASIDGLRAGFSANAPYAVTKAGAIQLSRVMAVAPRPRQYPRQRHRARPYSRRLRASPRRSETHAAPQSRTLGHRG